MEVSYPPSDIMYNVLLKQEVTSSVIQSILQLLKVLKENVQQHTHNHPLYVHRNNFSLTSISRSGRNLMIVFSTEINPSTMARCRGPFPSSCVFTCTIKIHVMYYLCTIITLHIQCTCTCATCHDYLIKYHTFLQVPYFLW